MWSRNTSEKVGMPPNDAYYILCSMDADIACVWIAQESFREHRHTETLHMQWATA